MNYEIALIITIEADSYEDALASADDFTARAEAFGENILAVFDYETDNEDQRVLYLPPAPVN